MKNIYQLPLFNVKDALQNYSKAIISLAKDYKIIISEDAFDVTDLYEIITLLIKLVLVAESDVS